MTKGIILRVEEGVTLSPEVHSALETLLPKHQINKYQEHANYQQLIQDRIDSLHSAFLFLVDAYPPKPEFTYLLPETIKQYAERCRAECDLKSSSLNLLQKELVNFTNKLLDIIQISWNWPSRDKSQDAIDALNEAEQYMLMTRGRYDLATISPMDFGRDEPEYFLQLDESISPLYPKLIKEIQEIKNQNYPKVPPAWFKELSPNYRAYFCNIETEVVEPQALYQELNVFSKAWASRISLDDPVAVYQHVKANSGWFKNMTPQPSPQLRALLGNYSEKPTEISKGLNELKKLLSRQIGNDAFLQSVSLVNKIPEWYWALPETQQYFLEHALKSADTIEAAMSFLPSRLRTIPAPANFARHRVFRLGNDGFCKEISPPKIRSSHIASRDVKDLTNSIKKRHALSNFEKVTEDAKPTQKILMQTLISPLAMNKWLRESLAKMKKLPPDHELFDQALDAVQSSSRAASTFQHNHPLNYTKYWGYTVSDNPDSLKLISDLRNSSFISPVLEELLSIYQDILKSPPLSATITDTNGRELFLSSIEQMIILFGLKDSGYSYGSCVSGKDRKAVELMHSDAMLIYWIKYGTWPKFNEPASSKARSEFEKIVEQLYRTGHHHKHANDNAPGVYGIKSPDVYLPAGIVNAINKSLMDDKATKNDDALASNNEVEAIVKEDRESNTDKKIAELKTFQCKLIAMQLGNENCTKLYGALYNLVNEKSRFKSPNKDWKFSAMIGKKSYAEAAKEQSTYLPTGILAILDIMMDAQGGDNVTRMGKILNEINKRPDYKADRSKETNSVYAKLRALIRPIPLARSDESDDPLEQAVNSPANNQKNLQQLVDEAVAEWEKLFNKSIGKKPGLVKVPPEPIEPQSALRV